MVRVAEKRALNTPPLHQVVTGGSIVCNRGISEEMWEVLT